MHMLMWELSDKLVNPETLNVAFSDAGLPPTAAQDSNTKAFRQAWRKFSSIKTMKYQAHAISDNMVGVIERTQAGADKKIQLDHLATLKITEHSPGNVQIYYICKPGENDHYNNITTLGTTCKTCGEAIPTAAIDIAQTFQKRLGSMSPEGRSVFYANYCRDLMKVVPFMSYGRPYILHDQYKEAAYKFKAAIDAIGDRAFILDLTNSEGAKQIVREGIKSELEKIKKVYDGLKENSVVARERRLEAIHETKQKIDMFRDILENYAEELDSIADKFTAMVRQDLGIESTTESPQAPDSTPSEHPASSSETPH